MIKLLVVGIWVCAVTLGSIYVAATWRSSPAQQPAQEHHDSGGVDHLKARVISVPIIAESAVQGYVVAQFVFALDSKLAKSLPIKPEPLLLDEAFRTVYADESIDFRRFRRQDLTALSKKILVGANKRLGSQVVRDVLIQELNYVPKEEARGRALQ